VVVMKDGVIHQSAGALEIYHRPANRFVASFLGSPPMNFFEGRLVGDGAALYFEEGSAKLRVPEWASEKLRSYAGAAVVLGVRPEALSDQAHARFETKDNFVTMKVRLVQPLGDTMHVHLETLQHTRVVAHLESFYGLAIGADIPVYFDPKRVHFFGAGENGKSLAHNDSFAEAALRGTAPSA
jgi:multiple sugar transport system ATP-binding protein